MKSAPLIVAALARLAIGGYGSANASDSPAAGDPSTDHVFELPQSAGPFSSATCVPQVDWITPTDRGRSVDGDCAMKQAERRRRGERA